MRSDSIHLLGSVRQELANIALHIGALVLAIDRVADGARQGADVVVPDLPKPTRKDTKRIVVPTGGPEAAPVPIGRRGKPVTCSICGVQRLNGAGLSSHIRLTHKKDWARGIHR